MEHIIGQFCKKPRRWSPLVNSLWTTRQPAAHVLSQSVSYKRSQSVDVGAQLTYFVASVFECIHAVSSTFSVSGRRTQRRLRCQRWNTRQQTSAVVITSEWFKPRFPLSDCKKIPRLFQDPQNVFPGFSRSPAMLNYKQQLLTVYSTIRFRFSFIELVARRLKIEKNQIHRKMLVTSCKETVQLAHSRNTSYIYLHTVFYTYKACWLSWNTKLNSRTLNFNLKGFPASNSFPGLSRSWKF